MATENRRFSEGPTNEGRHPLHSDRFLLGHYRTLWHSRQPDFMDQSVPPTREENIIAERIIKRRWNVTNRIFSAAFRGDNVPPNDKITYRVALLEIMQAVCDDPDLMSPTVMGPIFFGKALEDPQTIGAKIQQHAPEHYPEIQWMLESLLHAVILRGPNEPANRTLVEDSVSALLTRRNTQITPDEIADARAKTFGDILETQDLLEYGLELRARKAFRDRPSSEQLEQEKAYRRQAEIASYRDFFKTDIRTYADIAAAFSQTDNQHGASIVEYEREQAKVAAIEQNEKALEEERKDALRRVIQRLSSLAPQTPLQKIELRELLENFATLAGHLGVIYELPTKREPAELIEDENIIIHANELSGMTLKRATEAIIEHQVLQDAITPDLPYINTTELLHYLSGEIDMQRRELLERADVEHFEPRIRTEEEITQASEEICQRAQVLGLQRVDPVVEIPGQYPKPDYSKVIYKVAVRPDGNFSNIVFKKTKDTQDISGIAVYASPTDSTQPVLIDGGGIKVENLSFNDPANTRFAVQQLDVDYVTPKEGWNGVTFRDANVRLVQPRNSGELTSYGGEMHKVVLTGSRQKVSAYDTRINHVEMNDGTLFTHRVDVGTLTELRRSGPPNRNIYIDGDVGNVYATSGEGIKIAGTVPGQIIINDKDITEEVRGPLVNEARASINVPSEPQ